MMTDWMGSVHFSDGNWISAAAWVDNAAHQLHITNQHFPCSRDIEAMAVWQGYTLLLSSDTDCVSLWDKDGLIRVAHAGVYPQDMAITRDAVCICGGADGYVHLLTLPELQPLEDHSLPGMPERVSIHGNIAYILTLLTNPEVHTALLQLDLQSGRHEELARFTGLPGAVLAADSRLWVGVSEKLLRFTYGSPTPDLTVDGFGLIRHLVLQDDLLIAVDPVENLHVCLSTASPTLIEVLHSHTAH